MDDVVLHYRPGPAVGFSRLLEQTEKLLEPFPCRPPPVFSPWFPSAADRQLPIRPARPAPRISPAGGVLTEQRSQAGNRVVSVAAPPEHAERTEDALCISETPDHLLPGRRATPPSPRQHPGSERVGCPRRRSWSVFTQRGVLLQSSQRLSTRFHRLVSVHRLQLRQRAKWVITEQNCGDVEQVWRCLSRSVPSSRLPTCNANIQRDRAEIWVFCDLLYSEQVGRLLKDELQLSGSIKLSVHKLGTIFSM
uniref:Shieldin complex subunit 3 n=1 Tax=Fundulus heteroclitus TaxID=8078 RepID=A0A3Q2TMA2_FUNHE